MNAITEFKMQKNLNYSNRIGDIQSGWIIKGFGQMKETEIHRLSVTKWVIIEGRTFLALNVRVGGH